MKKKSIFALILSLLITTSTGLAGCNQAGTSTKAESVKASASQTVSEESAAFAVSSDNKEASDDSKDDKSAKKANIKDDAITIDNIRNYVVGVDEPVELSDGTKRPLINFDNAATTPVLLPVQQEVDKEFEMYGSIGRGFSQKSNHSTDLYNQVRDKVLNFVGANNDEKTYTCFYVNNTTDGLNKLASALIESEDDLVLTTRIEHHANDLSWRERCNVIYAEGYVTDVHRVAKIAHKYGAKIVVDGAQIVAHKAFSMIGDTPEENIDFFVFSAHKMYSPYGGGAVVGLTDVLNEHMPEFYGGGIVELVTDDKQYYKLAPARYEAGSPNYPGVVGLGKAIDILEEVGFDAIEKHEKALNRRLIDGLKKLDNVIIYGDTENIDDRVGVVTFNFDNINSLILATMLSENGGVATRRGAFCAHPYVWRMMKLTDQEIESFNGCSDIKTAGMVRISFGIYNTEEEVDSFLAMMPEIMKQSTPENYLRLIHKEDSIDEEYIKVFAKELSESYLKY